MDGDLIILWFAGIILTIIVGVTIFACIAAPIMDGNWTPDIGVGIGIVIFSPIAWAFKLLED